MQRQQLLRRSSFVKRTERLIIACETVVFFFAQPRLLYHYVMKSSALNKFCQYPYFHLSFNTQSTRVPTSLSRIFSQKKERKKEKRVLAEMWRRTVSSITRILKIMVQSGINRCKMFQITRIWRGEDVRWRENEKFWIKTRKWNIVTRYWQEGFNNRDTLRGHGIQTARLNLPATARAEIYYQTS